MLIYNIRAMKKHNLIYLLASITLFSCAKFLDKPPLDTITDKEMTFTQTEMQLYANQYYNAFPVFNGYSLGIFEADNSSDNMVSGDYNFNGQLSGTVTVPTSGGGWNWTAIRGINFFLANYQVTKETPEAADPY